MQVLIMSEIYEVSGGTEDTEDISVAEGGAYGGIAGAVGAGYFGVAGAVTVGDAITIGGALRRVIGVVAAGVGIYNNYTVK